MPTYRHDFAWLASEPAMVPLMALITGRHDFIGLHICLELLNTDLWVTVFDNFCSSQPKAWPESIKWHIKSSVSFHMTSSINPTWKPHWGKAVPRQWLILTELQAVNESLADRPVITPMWPTQFAFCKRCKPAKSRPWCSIRLPLCTVYSKPEKPAHHGPWRVTRDAAR